jgi:hypothetical protein
VSGACESTTGSVAAVGWDSTAAALGDSGADTGVVPSAALALAVNAR